jgi:Outer membrane lipoprotein-sorting protein
VTGIRGSGRLALGALVLAATAAGLRSGPAPGGPPPPFAQTGLPDAAGARELLERFRSAGMASGNFFLRFELREMPRRGDEMSVRGRLWGGRSEGGIAMRIELAPGGGAPSRFLVRNGPAAGVWAVSGALVDRVPEGATFEPLFQGLDITAFDLQMPYLYWPDVRVTGLSRVRGRPAYAFVFRPPAGYASGPGIPSSVRAYLDTEFDRPLQVELLADDGSVQKTLTLLDLRKVDGQWMLSEFDVRNESTRNKTRFELGDATLGADFGQGVLTPAALALEAAPPPARGAYRE